MGWGIDWVDLHQDRERWCDFSECRNETLSSISVGSFLTENLLLASQEEHRTKDFEFHLFGCLLILYTWIQSHIILVKCTTLVVSKQC
jgi:hypothetical protein